MHLPWRPPFADPRIYENPTLLSFLELFWQADDFRCTGMHSNTPYPGSHYQRWHRDGGGDRSWGVEYAGLRNPFLGVNVPLCATSEQNGSFEIVPGTVAGCCQGWCCDPACTVLTLLSPTLSSARSFHLFFFGGGRAGDGIPSS